MGMNEGGSGGKGGDLSKKRKCGGEEIPIFLARVFVQR